MISVDKAKSIVEKHFPDCEVKQAYLYNDSYYLFMAPNKNGKPDYNDPFYIVDMNNGNYRFFNPLEDFDGFEEAVDSNHIKDYEKSGDDS